MVYTKSCVTGPPCGPNYLGCRRLFHTRLHPRTLHSHFSHQTLSPSLLRHPRRQCCLLLLHCHYSLPYMPPYILPVGPSDTWWDVWGPEELGSIYWNIQSAYGCDGRRAADAGAVGIADGC